METIQHSDETQKCSLYTKATLVTPIGTLSTGEAIPASHMITTLNRNVTIASHMVIARAQNAAMTVSHVGVTIVRIAVGAVEVGVVTKSPTLIQNTVC